MKRFQALWAGLYLLALPLYWAVAQTPAAPCAVAGEQCIDEFLTVYTLDSPAAADNRLGESGLRGLAVLVPPAYLVEPGRRFPVVYWFHGMTAATTGFRSALNDFRYIWRKPVLPEQQFIMVAVDGRNRLGGTFYVNSPLSGRHEDMILNEILPFVDGRYRTLPYAAARVLAGHSMGGFAAWNLALAHPDRFGAAWACSPGIFDDTRFSRDYGFGNGVAYGAAFAPDMAADPPVPRTPRFDDSPEDKLVVALFKRGYGDFAGKLARYREKAVPLSEIRFDLGERETYAWIPPGVRAFLPWLQAAGIKAELFVHPGLGHSLDRAMIEAGLLPLTQRVFAGLKNSEP